MKPQIAADYRSYIRQSTLDKDIAAFLKKGGEIEKSEITVKTPTIQKHLVISTNTFNANRNTL